MTLFYRINIYLSVSPLFSCIWSSTAKVKFLPHYVYIEDRSFEGKNYTQFFGKNQHELGKNGLRMHQSSETHSLFLRLRCVNKRGSPTMECTICIHFSKIFPGETPGSPPAGGVSPSRTLPAALRADLVTPPAVDALDPPLPSVTFVPL